MHHRSINLDSLATIACWMLGLLLSTGDLFDFMPEDCGYLGLAFINLGVWLGHQRALDGLEDRERAAFELGREAGLHAVRR